MTRLTRGRLLGWPFADDGFGNQIRVQDYDAVWYFVTAEVR